MSEQATARLGRPWLATIQHRITQPSKRLPADWPASRNGETTPTHSRLPLGEDSCKTCMVESTYVLKLADFVSFSYSPASHVVLN